jgi:hypothetical protein
MVFGNGDANDMNALCRTVIEPQAMPAIVRGALVEGQEDANVQLGEGCHARGLNHVIEPNRLQHGRLARTRIVQEKQHTLTNFFVVQVLSRKLRRL